MCGLNTVEFREVNMNQVGIVVNLLVLDIMHILDTIGSTTDVFDSVGDLLWELYCDGHDAECIV